MHTGRTFLLGERLSYVLLSGARLQDEAAEDPLLTLEAGLVPAYELYFHNKLKASVFVLEIWEREAKRLTCLFTFSCHREKNALPSTPSFWEWVAHLQHSLIGAFHGLKS
jgi:hypothetical protein